MTAGKDTNVSLWVSLCVWVLAAGGAHTCRHVAIFICTHSRVACFVVQLYLCFSSCVCVCPQPQGSKSMEAEVPVLYVRSHLCCVHSLRVKSALQHKPGPTE